MLTHDRIERHTGLMVTLILIVISFGGLVQILPLFSDREVTEPLEDMRPLTALELEGRDIYIREGCHVCHTQKIRALRTEVERYGHYSVAGESVWDHPFLWGSKRTGPDLARIGGRYSDEWQLGHLYDPREFVPQSNMPAYPWLFDREVNNRHTARKMRVLQILGVPYSDEQIESAADEVGGYTEAEALVAYLQQLGTVLPRR